VPQPRASIFAIAIFLLICGSLTVGFSQKRRPPYPPPAQPPAASSEEAKWWAAQRNIAAAIAQLEAYLRAAPNGGRAATAKQQIAVLRSLSITASRPEWTRMDSLPLREIPEWRVASVERLNDRTRLMIEIKCERTDGGDCYFRPFDSFPLLLIDNAGQYYPMLEAASLPSDVKRRPDGQMLTSSSRVLNVAVDFAPLDPSVVSGQVYYRDNNQATPANFSLSAQLKKEEQ
jgi:hypothetical protein